MKYTFYWVVFEACIESVEIRSLLSTEMQSNFFCSATSNSYHYIQWAIKNILKSGNACYHSVRNILSSSLLSKSLKNKIYRTIILPVISYGFETWLLKLREERRRRMFENRVLRRILGLRGTR
jgi:hypothetical protein